MSFLDDPQVRRNVDRLPIEFGDYGFDRFGLSKKTLTRAYSPMAYLYRHYLKVTAFGLEHVPAEGRGLIIANHSGGLGADAMTVNAWFGTDGVAPFLKRAPQGKAIFVLVKTSNPSSVELQDLDTGDAKVCDAMADLVASWNADLIGERGYGAVGAVVGATFPEDLQKVVSRWDKMSAEAKQAILNIVENPEPAALQV